MCHGSKTSPAPNAWWGLSGAGELEPFRDIAQSVSIGPGWVIQRHTQPLPACWGLLWLGLQQEYPGVLSSSLSTAAVWYPEKSKWHEDLFSISRNDFLQRFYSACDLLLQQRCYKAAPEMQNQSCVRKHLVFKFSKLASPCHTDLFSVLADKSTGLSKNTVITFVLLVIST